MFSGAVMKKLATCLIGVVGLIGTPAFAADMAVKARPLPAHSFGYCAGKVRRADNLQIDFGYSSLIVNDVPAS
jgi:hypothetical protein